jgi:hypothetical protein
MYLLIDLPGLAPVEEPTAELHDFGPTGPVTGTGQVVIVVACAEVCLDLSRQI